MDIIKISDVQLALNLAIFVLIMVILMIAMSFAGNLQPQYVALDAYRPYQDYYSCAPTSLDGFNAVLGVVLAAAFLFILVGLVLAWKVRQIPFAIYDESKVHVAVEAKEKPSWLTPVCFSLQVIAFSMYNVAFFSIVLVALRLSRATSRDVLFGLQSIGIVICSMVTLLTLFVSKTNWIRSTNNSAASTRNNTRGNTNPVGTSTGAGKPLKLSHLSGHSAYSVRFFFLFFSSCGRCSDCFVSCRWASRLHR